MPLKTRPWMNLFKFFVLYLFSHHPSPNRVLKLSLSNCLAKTSILSIDGANFSFYGMKYRVIEKRVDFAPRPSPNRAKTSVLSSERASFSFQEIMYRVIESRVVSVPHPSPNRVLKLCSSNCLAKTIILSSDGASIYS